MSQQTWILECAGTIYGSGCTPEAALEDARGARGLSDLDDAGVIVVAHPSQRLSAGAIAIWPATQRLVDAARRDPQGLCWDWSWELGAADVA